MKSVFTVFLLSIATLMTTSLLFLSLPHIVTAFEPTGKGERARENVDIAVCHACAAVSQEFCEEGMYHQEYLEEKLHMERKNAKQLEEEALARGEYDKGPEKLVEEDVHSKLPGLKLKYKTNEQTLRDLSFGVCDDFRMMKYDHFKAEINAGGKRLMTSCEWFIRDQSENLIEFFSSFYLMEISCVRGVDIFCNDYVDVCRNFDITLVKAASGKQTALYIPTGSKSHLYEEPVANNKVSAADDPSLSADERKRLILEENIKRGSIFVEGEELPTSGDAIPAAVQQRNKREEDIKARQELEQIERARAMKQPHQPDDTRPLNERRGQRRDDDAEFEAAKKEATKIKVTLPSEVEEAMDATKSNGNGEGLDERLSSSSKKKTTKKTSNKKKGNIAGDEEALMNDAIEDEGSAPLNHQHDVNEDDGETVEDAEREHEEDF